MAAAVKITRTAWTAPELRLSALKSRDARTVRRMLASALVLEGPGHGGGKLRDGPSDASGLGASLQ